MAHHAYFFAGDSEAGISQAHAFLRAKGVEVQANPDVATFRYTNLTVDDARHLITLASQAPTKGEVKALVISAIRLFHEAQNAMLKLFEEPTPGTTLVLIVPSEGVLLPTLRSRLIPLPNSAGAGATPRADAFLGLSEAEQKKQLEKIYNRSKSDKPEEKQEARREALELVQELTRTLHRGGDQELMKDLTFFSKTLHERSAPLKLIFEHLALVLPKMKSSSGG